MAEHSLKDEAPLRAAQEAALVRRTVEAASWYCPEATGRNEHQRPLHLVYLRMVLLAVTNSLLDVAEVAAEGGREARGFAARASTCLWLVHALVTEALLEHDIAVTTYRLLTTDNRFARCASLLRSCGAEVVQVVRTLSLLFDPRQLPGLPPPPPTGFSVRTSSFAKLLGVGSAQKGESIFQRVAEVLVREGHAVLADVLETSVAAAIAGEVSAMDPDLWTPATVKMRGQQQHQQSADLRGDRVWWLDGCDRRRPLLSALAQWLRHTLVGELRQALNRPGLEGPFRDGGLGDALGETSKPVRLEDTARTLPYAMLACYPGGGARFRAHVDNSLAMPDDRVLTAVLYLNSSWAASDGGALRLLRPLAAGGSSLIASPNDSPSKPPPASALLEVLPELNTLVLFWSRLVEHEVLPSWRPRYAVSLWARTSRDEPP